MSRNTVRRLLAGERTIDLDQLSALAGTLQMDPADVLVEAQRRMLDLRATGEH